MTLSELVAAVGDEKILVQSLSDCLIDSCQYKGATKVCFGTHAVSVGHLATGTGMVGMIVWFPREEFENVARNHDETDAGLQ